MKITVCGSMRFWPKMQEAEKKLSALGHKIVLPIKDSSIGREKGEQFFLAKRDFEKQHMQNIASSDAILVLNYEKDGKQNYLGGATFSEMAVAFHLNKKIFLLNPAPDYLHYFEEIIAMQPKILNGALEKIK